MMKQDNAIRPSNVSPRSYQIILLLIVTWASVIRLSAIHRTVRMDEARSMQEFAQRPPTEFLFDFSDTNNHFLNTLLMHIQYRLLGNDKDWKIRVHVFVIGILVTIATYYAGKELYDADVGLMASALSSVMYMLVEFSINARGYIIITLIFLILLIQINRMKTQANRRAWIFIGLLTALGFLVSIAFLYALGTLFVWAAISILVENKGQIRRRIFSYFVGSMILATVLTATYYMLAISLTFSSWEAFRTSYIARLAQPFEFQSFVNVIIPQSFGILFELTHTGMSTILIMICVLGLFITCLFHYKLTKSRFPLIVAIIIWLSMQLIVQRSDIFERVFTFLNPIYAILIAVGLIALVRFVTQNRIPRFYIAIVLSLIMCVPISYQLISRQILLTARLTGSIPNANVITESLQNLLEPGDHLLNQAITGKILDYYFWRNKSAIQVDSHFLLDENYFSDWKLLGDTRYLIDRPNITLSALVEQWNNLVTGDIFMLKPVASVSDHLYLYSLTISPTVDIDDPQN